MGRKGAVGAAGLELLDALGNAAVNDGLWFEHNPALFGLGLKHVANGDANLIPHLPRDDYLVFVFEQ